MSVDADVIHSQATRRVSVGRFDVYSGRIPCSVHDHIRDINSQRPEASFIDERDLFDFEQALRAESNFEHRRIFLLYLATR